MSENKIPTAAEFTELFDDYTASILEDIGETENIHKLMIEFAKMHVKAALEAAKATTALSKWSEEDDCCIAKTNTFEIDLCYRPENIK